jgi:pimeloyl-ACP methyl ester carboxylesterase
MPFYLCPGFGCGRAWYEPLLGCLPESRFVPLPGMPGGAPLPHPWLAARAVVRSLPDEPMRVWIGHSAGAHLARACAALDQQARAVVLIDPNLYPHLPRWGRDWVPPRHFPNRRALLQWYAERGMDESSVQWGWWESTPQGWHLLWEPELLCQYAESVPRNDPVRELERLARRMRACVVYTAAASVTGVAGWVRLRCRAARVRVCVAWEISHRLLPEEQPRLGMLLQQWLYG